MLDANSGFDDKDVQDLMDDTGLINMLMAKHPFATLLRTYNRGRKALDMSLGCLVAIKFIKAIGLLEFYRIIPTDHRSIFIDLYEKQLMALAKDETKSTQNVPSLLCPSTVEKFIATYKALLGRANLFEKVQIISERMETATPKEMTILIERLNKYDQVWVELLKAATLQSKCKIGGIKPWSPALAQSGSIVRYWNSWV